MSPAARVAQSPALVDAPHPELWRPAFPPAELVAVAAAGLWDAGYERRLLARRPVAGLGTPEGPRYFVTVAPGALRFRRADPARYQRRLEREYVKRGQLVALSVAWLGYEAERAAVRALIAGGLLLPGDALPARLDPLAEHPSRQRITEWSAKSRANMVWRMLTLDYSPLYAEGRRPAMCTLTMPDGWEAIAPTGAAFKVLFRAWRKRYARAWGEELRCVWKLEFQRRGAPHLHMLTAPPTGLSRCGRTWRDWYSQSWADVLGLVEGHPARDDVVWFHSRPQTCANYAEGLRCSDPRRVAVYFTKHGLLRDKEYQHAVPVAWQEEGAGPGRFWGTPGLEPVEKSAELEAGDVVRLARLARRYDRANSPITRDHAGTPRGGVRVVDVWRTKVNRRTGEVTLTRRTVRRRVRRLRATYGFLAVNDGPAVADVLSRALWPD